MEALGHEVKLIAPQHVRLFLRRQTNDSADAERTFSAAHQSEVRNTKSKERKNSVTSPGKLSVIYGGSGKDPGIKRG